MTMPADAPLLEIVAVDLFERDVKLRLPFRFGIVTLTEAPQAFARVRIRLADGREAVGVSAEVLAPKWFDKNPDLSNEENFDQLRAALGPRQAAQSRTMVEHQSVDAIAVVQEERQGDAEREEDLGGLVPGGVHPWFLV